MQVYSKIDIGKVRKTNQDAAYTGVLSDGSVLAVVCDGMGGANAGNIASKNAVELISKYVKKSYSSSLLAEQKSNLLQNAIVSANIEIYKTSLNNETLRGMGTTAVAVLADETSAVIAHVGDSRAYKIGQKLIQITRDHSIVQNLIESGKLTAEEAKNYPEKNVITRALGVEENVIADISVIPFVEGESLLVCTDGLSNFIDTETILNIIKDNEIETACDNLIKKANENGGGDNITVVIIRKG